MGQILIRNLPDDVLLRLKRRAVESGLSAEAFARQTLQREAMLATQEERREAIRRIDAIRATTRAADKEASGPVLRRFRDAGGD